MIRRGPRGANNSTETDSSETDSEFDTMEDGFLYKPKSESGGLVILLPSKYRESKVRLLDSEGEVIEQGRSSGYANGDREHFRFPKPGEDYPDGTIVEVELEDGTIKKYKIDDTSMRYDSGGVSTGGSGGGGKLSTSQAESLMGLGINEIDKPTVADKFKSKVGQSQAEGLNVFKSPLTTLETIRSVTNIIVGSSKSFDDILTKQQQQAQLEQLSPQLNLRGRGQGGVTQEEEEEPPMTTVPGYNI